MSDRYLKKLDLPLSLAYRVLCRNAPPNHETDQRNEEKNFVLYLPTVVLRKRHNPGFALACRIANYHKLPLIVLCTVLDDEHLTRKPHKPICMTSRRLAFTLEALQCCTQQWERHGAGVAIRVHGTGARAPHHLTLAFHALAVVTDEPFVEPFRTYVRKIVGTCQTAKVLCFSVDGSTTVPPKSKLQVSQNQSFSGDICFDGVPPKSWMWEKTTNPHRRSHVFGAVRDGFLDSPDLIVRLPADFFLHTATTSDVNNSISRLHAALPAKWKDSKSSAPGTRPWTVNELATINNLKEWSMVHWEGADTTVPPCTQTHGSEQAAKIRWKEFLNQGLANYAKRRNQIVLPCAVSRMSCYFNLGIFSIFDVISDVWQSQAGEGQKKFLDEVIKWREIGYAFSFANPGYHSINAIPKWAQAYLNGQQQQNTIGSKRYGHEELDTSATNDPTWDAMQTYLVQTGELHNNARMTWGKTVVHWQAACHSPEEVFWQLICLNDRYALDGLSPPSYAGLLWCFGWCDKPGPGGSLSTKWASRYRQGPEGFEIAKQRLLEPNKTSEEALNSMNIPSSNKKPRRDDVQGTHRITSFFTSIAP